MLTSVVFTPGVDKLIKDGHFSELNEPMLIFSVPDQTIYYIDINENVLLNESNFDEMSDIPKSNLIKFLQEISVLESDNGNP